MTSATSLLQSPRRIPALPAALLISFAVHGALWATMTRARPRPAPAGQVALQIAVVDAAPPAPPPSPQPVKLDRPSRGAPPRPRNIARTAAPPPPTQEAAKPAPPPPIVTGITLESTAQGGSMAVGTGNTLSGAPARTATDPGKAKPYRADRYAQASQLTELPRLLNRGELDLRRCYPAAARNRSFEGDVVLRLVIDFDGRVATAEVASDPGEGLGEAAVRCGVPQLRFEPARVNGQAVATSVPFTLHFTLH